jgi:tyrosine-protein kinase Etk/Wzc
MEHNPDLKRVLRQLIDERKRIALVVGVVSAATAIVSLFLPNYYKATSIYYVSSSDMATVEHFYGRAKKDLEYFGTDTDIDRMMSVARSNELFQFLIDSFQLAKHYGIKMKSPRDGVKLFKRTHKHFQVVKNKYNAIELSFEDKDPAFAAKVANAARSKIDDIILRLVRDKQKSQIEAFKENLEQKESSLQLLANTLDSLRSVYNIVNLSSQSDAMATLISDVESGFIRESAKLEALKDSRNVKRDTIEMIAATVKGLEKELNTLKSGADGSTYSLARFNEGRRKIEIVEASYFLAKEHVGYDTERLKQLISAYNARIPMLIVLEEATPPVMKHRPVRSLYVLGAFLSSLLLVCFYVVFKESFKAFSLAD